MASFFCDAPYDPSLHVPLHWHLKSSSSIAFTASSVLLLFIGLAGTAFDLPVDLSGPLQVDSPTRSKTVPASPTNRSHTKVAADTVLDELVRSWFDGICKEGHKISDRSE